MRQNRKQIDAHDYAWSALYAGLLGNLLAIALSASILLIDPPGSEIRPMHIPPLLILIAFGTALVSIPQAILGLFQKRGTLTSIAGLVLGSTPLITGLIAFFSLVGFFGYTLKD